MPNLLVAPSQVNRKDQSSQVDGDQIEWLQGCYADGAYMANSRSYSGLGLPDDSTDYDNEDDLDPQEAYYISLGSRFQNFRLPLQSTPPILNPKSISDSAAIASSLYSAKHAKWRYICLYTTPSMRVLATMQQEVVIRGLQIMETLLTKKNLLGVKEGRNLGAWSWGMLGRCRDVGQMGSEDVSVLRMLGKKALGLSRKMRTHIVDAEESADDGADDDLENTNEDGSEKGDITDGLHEDFERRRSNTSGAEEAHGQESTKLDVTKYTGENVPLTLPNGLDRHFSDMIPADSSMPQEAPKNPLLGIDTTPSTNTSDDTLYHAKANLLDKLHPQSSFSLPVAQGIATGTEQNNETNERLKALATLDVIVTIIGEAYGQRDLLDERVVWGKFE